MPGRPASGYTSAATDGYLSRVTGMATHGNRRAPLRAALTAGQAELRPDPEFPQAWTLLVDGVPQ